MLHTCTTEYSITLYIVASILLYTVIHCYILLYTVIHCYILLYTVIHCYTLCCIHVRLESESSKSTHTHTGMQTDRDTDLPPGRSRTAAPSPSGRPSGAAGHRSRCLSSPQGTPSGRPETEFSGQDNLVMNFQVAVAVQYIHVYSSHSL